MSEGEKKPAVDLEAGTITLKNGDETKTFNIRDANDLGSLVALGQRGMHFDSTASVELGQLRKTINNWDSAIEAARKSDEGFNTLKGQLENLIGRKLTTEEKKTMQQDDPILFDSEENTKLLGVIKGLQDEITNLKQSHTDFVNKSQQSQIDAEKAKINKTASSLEEKYNGENGTPKFNRMQVLEFAANNNITDLELAFKMQNFDALTKVAQQGAVAEFKKEQEKLLADRRKGFVENGDGNFAIEAKPGREKNFNNLQSQAMKTVKSEGLSLFKSE